MTDKSSAESRKKVLVVEDELIIAKGVEKRLMALGYAVAGTAASGEEALAKVLETSPDLLLMDIHLQGNMDGIETAEKIRAVADIPIIYLTAYADPDSLGRAKLTEPFGYIVKPFQDQTLRSAIEMALYKHQMEHKLRRSEQWLATILRSIGDAIIATDAQGLITFMNPVASSLTGWEQKEALGRELLEVFRVREEAPAATTENIVRNVIHNGITVSFPGRNCLLSRDGREIPIEAKATPFLGVPGKNMGLALIFLDISERIRTEDALRRSERLLSIKNQVANVFLTVPDEEMYAEVLEVIMNFMESPNGIFGYIDEVGNLVIPSLTKNVWDECRVHEKTIIFPRDKWGGLWGRALKEGRPLFGSGAFKVPEGHVAINSFLAVPIVYRGVTIGLISVANREGGYVEEDRDLLQALASRIAPILKARLERDRQEKERRRAEEELLKSESQLRSIFDAIPDLISVRYPRHSRGLEKR